MKKKAIKRKAVKKMAFITPKTDWKSTDYFEPDDYERIKENLKDLQERAALLFYPKELTDMTEGKTYESMIYASEFNVLENNIAQLDTDTYQIGFGKKTWTANARTPDYGDLNRMEGALAAIDAKLTEQYAKVKRFPFILGQAGA